MPHSQHVKNELNSYINSLDTVDFRVSWTKWPCPFLTIPTQKSLKYVLAFLNLHQHAKYHFITSIHSFDKVNFRVLGPDWPLPFLTMFTQKLFDQLLIRLFYWFVMKIWLIKKSWNLIGWEHFGPYLKNKNFPK